MPHLCDQRGWQPVEYVDNDESATSGKRRPDYEQMLADIREGRVDAVVAWDLDRLHRRPIELEAFMALADEKHLALATVSGDVDLSTAQGRLVARLKGSVAAHETEHKRARQLRAARQKAERGEAKWKRAFGYFEDSRQPDPVTAPLVRQAHAAILAGASLNDVVRLFNDAGAVGLNKRPWSASTVSLFLRAPRNAGLRSHQGQIVCQGNWPGLVDEETWHAAQAVLTAPGRAPGPKSVRKHVLTGLMKCGKPGCDGYLSGLWVMHKTGGKPGRPKGGEVKQHDGQMAHSIAYACKTCRGVSIRAKDIEPLVYSIIGKRLARPDAVDLLRAEQHDNELAEATRAELAKLYAKLDQLAIEHAEELLTARQVKVSTDVVNAKIAKLEASQHDQERLRVFEGLPLGKPEVVDAVRRLSPDRFRAVAGVLAAFTVAPVGKGHRVNGKREFDPERVQVDWN